MERLINLADLYATLAQPAHLEWLVGQQLASEVISTDTNNFSNGTLVGPFDLVHPSTVQLIGRVELNYLENSPAALLQENLSHIQAQGTRLLIITDGLTCSDSLLDTLRSTSVPVLTSRLIQAQINELLLGFMSSRTGEQKTVHGVFLAVFGVGVLITGPSGVGKSELALELISREHRLICDDAPQFRRSYPDVLIGSCPPVLQDFLEVRGLGVMNIRAIFGEQAIQRTKKLELVIDLVQLDSSQIKQIDRLMGDRGARKLLGIEVPEIRLPVTAGRNLGVLVETAVRDHLLRLGGYEAHEQLSSRQAAFMETSVNEPDYR